MSTSTPELDPGKTLSLSGILYPDLSGDLLPNLSYVTEKEAGGAVDNTAVISAQPDQGGRLTASAKGKPGGVQLKWQAVPGATGYQIWSTAGWPSPIPNPPYLSLTQFSGSPLATVGAVTKDTVTGLPGTPPPSTPSFRLSAARRRTWRTNSSTPRPVRRPSPSRRSARSRAPSGPR